MKERFIHLLAGSPHEITTIVLAMLPISELRGAIPYAITIGKMPWQEAYVISVIANFIPVIFILWLVGPVSEYLRRFAIFNRFFNWLFARTRRKGKMIERLATLAPILFVAIPAPMTGAWTGSIAAYLFKLPLRMAIPCIILGILIAGVVVTLVSQGVISLWH